MEEKHIFVADNKDLGAPISGDMVKKAKKKKKRDFVVALILFSLAFAALCAALIYLDSSRFVPDKLFREILIGVGGFIILEILLLIVSLRKKALAFVSGVLCFAALIASVLGIYALYKFNESMSSVDEPTTYYAYVGIFVKKDSSFTTANAKLSNDQEESDQVSEDVFDGCSVGTMLLNLDAGYTSQAMRMFRKEHDINVIAYDDFGSMIDALKNGLIDAVFYNESYMSIFLGEGTDFYDWAVEMDRLGIETEHSASANKADVTAEPFLVYVSGLDTSNQDTFDEHCRSDVNIIAAVDPVKKKILLINTPRDYYVPLWGKSYAMDKLTHAGVYGVDCSMQTLEALYGIEFNYYVRTNIFSLMKVVDALGGITVHSDIEFYAKSYGGEHQFYVGHNEVDGEGALLFIRERASFTNGDKQRGIHQQEVIRAIIEKACSPAIIAHFSDVLDVVTKSIQTNIGREEINALIKMQLSDMASWTVDSKSVDGYGSMEHSYAIGMSLDTVWVMIPYYDSVNEAKEALKEFMAA